MQKRQQTEAIIDAHEKIVHDAVSMVEMALAELSEKDILKLEDKRRATMVGNLLVVALFFSNHGFAFIKPRL